MTKFDSSDVTNKLLINQNVPNMQWKPLYNSISHIINDIGEIRSTDKTYVDAIGRTMTRISKPITKRKSLECDNYFSTVNLRFNNSDLIVNKTVYIHKAVADHFIKKPLKIRQYEKKGGTVYATHIIKDYENNSAVNIKWITAAESISTQPKRLEDPYKSWHTRRAKYGNKAGKP